MAAGGCEIRTENWGYFKVPGSWPGTGDHLLKDSQTVFVHPSWQEQKLGAVTAAWCQREITVPAEWAGRSLSAHIEYLNSYAAVFVDGKRVGEMQFPGGDVDITSVCRPRVVHQLSVLLVALPLKGVMLSYIDSAAAREVKGSVARRGLCGDMYLVGAPRGPRIADVKVETSVRRQEAIANVAMEGLAANVRYSLRARVTQNGRSIREFTRRGFQASELNQGRIAITEKWMPDKLWDIHTPQNIYDLEVALLDDADKALDTYWPARFGFREFWIEGRDFFLNGSRIFLSGVPFDNAQVGAALASYVGARESMERLKSFGINFVYTQLRRRSRLALGLHRNPARGGRCGNAGGLFPATLQPL